jgi:hypothetical protein
VAQPWHVGVFGAAYGVVTVPLYTRERDPFEGRNMIRNAAIGAALGSLIGIISPYEHWRWLR